VKAVSFTGSSEVGMRLKADLADRPIRVQLEMGSSNPFIVWEDADLDEAARLVAEGAYFYAGQKCTATSRVLVHSAVYDRFKEALVRAVDALKVDDPLDDATRVGPLIDRSSLESVDRAVRQAIEDGGKVVTGGQKSPREGYFYKPTAIEGLPLTAGLAQQEVFGPILTLHPVAGLREAIDGANATRYGLSASISTHNLVVAEEFMEGVEAGLVHVNQPTAGVEYQVPFGGYRFSGFGPKEQGWSALDFYSDWKTEVIRPA
jgi:aldehyde dehydrogenase (NAD+)